MNFYCEDQDCEKQCESCITVDNNENITRPSHYHKGGIDVISFMEQHFKDRKYSIAEGFFIGNILKYTCRYKEKNGQDDLIKARDYLERLMKLEGDR